MNFRKAAKVGPRPKGQRDSLITTFDSEISASGVIPVKIIDTAVPAEDRRYNEEYLSLAQAMTPHILSGESGLLRFYLRTAVTDVGEELLWEVSVNFLLYGKTSMVTVELNSPEAIAHMVEGEGDGDAKGIISRSALATVLDCAKELIRKENPRKGYEKILRVITLTGEPVPS